MAKSSPKLYISEEVFRESVTTILDVKADLTFIKRRWTGSSATKTIDEVLKQLNDAALALDGLRELTQSFIELDEEDRT